MNQHSGSASPSGYLERGLAICVVVLSIFCAVADFFLVRSNVFNADNVQNFNELTAVLHGNILLHGWAVTNTDNFYFSDLLFYLIGSIFAGPRPILIYLVPYAEFLLLILGCIFIIRSAGTTLVQRHTGTLAVLILLGLPFGSPSGIFLLSAIHSGTMMLSVYALLIAQRLLTPEPGPSFLLMPFSVIVFAITASDTQADYYLLLPFLALFLLHLWLFKKASGKATQLAFCVIISLIAGSAFPYWVSNHGGFELSSNYSAEFVASIPAAISNIFAAIKALTILYDASADLLVTIFGSQLISLTRLITMAFVLVLCSGVIWHIPQKPRQIFTQWLVTGAVFLGLADVMSDMFHGAVVHDAPGPPIFALRYVAPIYIYLSLAAILEAQTILADLREAKIYKWLWIFGAVFSAVFVFGATNAAFNAARQQPYIASAPQKILADWLKSRGLTYGVGDYWATQMVDALGGNKINADPVRAETKLVPFHWAGNMADLNAHRPPQFVIFTPVNQANITLANVSATYGTPTSVYSVDGYVVALLPTHTGG